MKIRTCVASLNMIVLAALACGGGRAQAQQAELAVWKAHDLDFQYMGFTSRFSCEGLRDGMRQVLLRLGARPEHLEVTPGACSGIEDRPSRISGVHLHFESLQPAAGAAAPVNAYCKPVVIGGDQDDDCELYQQIASDVLPLFATRKVESHFSNCIPHQATAVPPEVRLEVLSARS